MNSKILFISPVTHDVKRFIIEKPEGYEFTPGQATEVSINKEGWKDKKHPFTFTSLNEDKVLEFIIKGYPVEKYPSHKGFTEKLHSLKPGDELIIRDPWGTINYKGTGVFIAGGAGITPFIAILRQLKEEQQIRGNKLLFSNKSKEDIILEKEFKSYLGDEAVFTLTQEEAPRYEYGRIDAKFLDKYVEDYSQNFYVCGPPAMVKDIKEILNKLGADAESLVFEE